MSTERIDRRMKKSALSEIPRFFLLIATVLIFFIFYLLAPKFLTFANFMNILASACITAMLAFAALVGMSCGEMNFAVGSQATLSAAVVGALMSIKGFPYIPALLIGLGASMLLGYLGIGLTIKFGVPSFIATLGLSTIADGTIKYLTDNKYMFSNNWGDDFMFLGRAYVGPVPVSVIAFAVLSIAAWILVDKTMLGRHIFAVGANSTACRQVGINNNKIKIIAFLISSAFAGMGGIIECGQIAAVSPTMGSDIMMNAIAAAMLSATFLRPGRYNVQGTVIAAILMIIIQNGMLSIGAPNYTRDIIQGAILLFAVGFIALTRKEGLPAVKFS